MTATINPYRMRISKHAAERYAQRAEKKDKVTKADIERAREAMRDVMIAAVDQDPPVRGPKNRRNYAIGKFTFVVTEERDEVITFYVSKPMSPSLRKKREKEKKNSSSKSF